VIEDRARRRFELDAPLPEVTDGALEELVALESAPVPPQGNGHRLN
jgi:hypothetical protein